MFKSLLVLSSLVIHAAAGAIMMRQDSNSNSTDPPAPVDTGTSPPSQPIPITKWGQCTPPCQTAQHAIELLDAHCPDGVTECNVCNSVTDISKEVNINAVKDCNACLQKEGPSVLGEETLKEASGWDKSMIARCPYDECSSKCNEEVTNMATQCRGIYYESCQLKCNIKGDECHKCLSSSSATNNQEYLPKFDAGLKMQHFWCSNSCGQMGLDWRAVAKPCWGGSDTCKEAACTAEGNSKREAFSKCFSSDNDVGGLPSLTRENIQIDIDTINSLCKDTVTAPKCDSECSGILAEVLALCTGNDTSKCTSMCADDKLKALETCNSCIQDGSKSYPDSEKKDYQEKLNELKTWCSNNKSNPNPPKPPAIPNPNPTPPSNNNNNNNSNGGGSSRGTTATRTGAGSASTSTSSKSGAVVTIFSWSDVAGGLAVAMLLSFT
ncbi:uncharacterized protein LOC62_07G009090 [Vanrija pseudolonga]|uniref:Uncharacterized protein n=1 Tax=Vanrija pseudolonga TaxID=143232 RepID=A0AAF1BR73_9TREE|nr:hypothetical protein LOC62_07G009090 [Vanrija pseudolonga]